MHPSNRGRQWIFGCLASLSRNRRGDFVSQGYCRGSLGLARTPERRRRGHTCHITSDRRRADMNAGQCPEHSIFEAYGADYAAWRGIEDLPPFESVQIFFVTLAWVSSPSRAPMGVVPSRIGSLLHHTSAFPRFDLTNRVPPAGLSSPYRFFQR